MAKRRKRRGSQTSKFTKCAKRAPKGKGSGPRRRAFMSKCLKGR